MVIHVRISIIVSICILFPSYTIVSLFSLHHYSSLHDHHNSIFAFITTFIMNTNFVIVLIIIIITIALLYCIICPIAVPSLLHVHHKNLLYINHPNNFSIALWFSTIITIIFKRFQTMLLMFTYHSFILHETSSLLSS